MRDITSCAHAADSNTECDDEDAEADEEKVPKNQQRTRRTLAAYRRRTLRRTPC